MKEGKMEDVYHIALAVISLPSRKGAIKSAHVVCMKVMSEGVETTGGELS